MNPKLLLSLLLTGIVTTVAAEVTDEEIIQAQIASTMASVDYAKRNCPNLLIDEELLKEQVELSNMSVEALRETEDYAEQRHVLLTMDKEGQEAMICLVLPMAHGGYGSDIIVSR